MKITTINRTILIVVLIFLAAPIHIYGDAVNPEGRIIVPDKMLGRTMNSNIQPAADLVNGKVERMENALQSRQTISQDNEQPEVDSRQAGNPEKASGEQVRGKKTLTAPSGSHLSLIVKIDQDGNAEIMSVVELPGDAVMSEEPIGDYVYAVTSDSETVAAQAMPDPFEMRSFAGPKGSPMEERHHITRAKTAIIGITVPKMSLDKAKSLKLGIQIYKIPQGLTIEKINPSTIRKLHQENKLEVKVNYPFNKVMKAIEDKGVKLAPSN